MKNILLVDGYNFIRYTLRQLINSDPELNVVGEAQDVAEALEQLKTSEIDVIVIDVSMPDKNGLETFCDLKQVVPQIPVLIVSGSEDANYALNFIRLGCKGYLPKYSTDDQILRAIRNISAGKTCLPEPLQHVAAAAQSKSRKPHDGLSAREFQVFFKLAKGKSISSVAQELYITTSSVSVFRSKILKKMNFKSNADLIYYALKNNLIISPHKYNSHWS